MVFMSLLFWTWNRAQTGRIIAPLYLAKLMQTKHVPWSRCLAWCFSAIRTCKTWKLYSLDDSSGPLSGPVFLRPTCLEYTSFSCFCFLTDYILKQNPSKSSGVLCLVSTVCFTPWNNLVHSKYVGRLFIPGPQQGKICSGRGPELASSEYSFRVMQVRIALKHQTWHLDYGTCFVYIDLARYHGVKIQPVWARFPVQVRSALEY